MGLKTKSSLVFKHKATGSIIANVSIRYALVLFLCMRFGWRQSTHRLLIVTMCHGLQERPPSGTVSCPSIPTLSSSRSLDLRLGGTVPSSMVPPSLMIPRPLRRLPRRLQRRRRRRHRRRLLRLLRLRRRCRVLRMSLLLRPILPRPLPLLKPLRLHLLLQPRRRPPPQLLLLLASVPLFSATTPVCHGCALIVSHRSGREGRR